MNDEPGWTHNIINVIYMASFARSGIMMAQETGFLFWVHGIYDVVIVNGFIRHALGNPYSQDTDTHQFT